MGSRILDVAHRSQLGMPASCELVNFDGSVQSGELTERKTFLLQTTQTCHVTFGTSPTATTSHTPLFNDRDYWFTIRGSGIKVAAIKGSTAGILYLTEMDAASW